jgi:hypothetical protein
MSWIKSSFCETTCLEASFQNSSYCDGGTCLEASYQRSKRCDSNGCLEAKCHHGYVMVRNSTYILDVAVFLPQDWKLFIDGFKYHE